MSARVMILNFLSCKNHLCFLATFYYRVVFTSVSENALACSLQGQQVIERFALTFQLVDRLLWCYHLDEPTLVQRFYTTIYL